MKKSASGALATALGISLAACNPAAAQNPTDTQAVPETETDIPPMIPRAVYGGPPMDRYQPEPPPVVQRRLGYIVRVTHKLKNGDRADVYSDDEHSKLLVPNALVLRAKKRSVELSLTESERTLIKNAKTVYVLRVD